MIFVSPPIASFKLSQRRQCKFLGFFAVVKNPTARLLTKMICMSALFYGTRAAKCLLVEYTSTDLAFYLSIYFISCVAVRCLLSGDICDILLLTYYIPEPQKNTSDLTFPPDSHTCPEHPCLLCWHTAWRFTHRLVPVYSHLWFVTVQLQYIATSSLLNLTLTCITYR